MKKYKVRNPLIHSNKIIIITLYLFTIIGVVGLFTIPFCEWYSVCVLIALALSFASAIIDLGASFKYAYLKKSICFYFCGIKFREIQYKTINGIIISDAIYNSGKYDTNYADLPMCYKVVNGVGKREKIQYAYITVSKKATIDFSLITNKNSRSIHLTDTENFMNVGICWNDSFRDLLEKIDSDVYILENVYLRFKDEFDGIISLYDDNQRHFYIVPTSMRKTGDGKTGA